MKRLLIINSKYEYIDEINIIHFLITIYVQLKQIRNVLAFVGFPDNICLVR